MRKEQDQFAYIAPQMEVTKVIVEGNLLNGSIDSGEEGGNDGDGE